MTVEFIKPTKRSKMTKVRAAKIFLAANGIFIANAPADVDFLLARIEELEAQIPAPPPES